MLHIALLASSSPLLGQVNSPGQSIYAQRTRWPIDKIGISREAGLDAGATARAAAGPRLLGQVAR